MQWSDRPIQEMNLIHILVLPISTVAVFMLFATAVWSSEDKKDAIRRDEIRRKDVV